MNPLRALLRMPTCEEVLGPYHYSLFSELQREFQKTLTGDKQELLPVIESIADRLESELSMVLRVSHSYPVFHETGDTGGYGPHIFAIRRDENDNGLALTSLGRLTKRRTIALISINDSTNSTHRWAGIAVAVSLKANLRSKVLEIIKLYLREHLDIPDDSDRIQIGFGHNFALLNWTPRRAHALRW